MGFYVFLGLQLLLAILLTLLACVIYAFRLKAKEKFTLWRLAIFGTLLCYCIEFMIQVGNLSLAKKVIVAEITLVSNGQITSAGYIHAAFISLPWAAAGLLAALICWFPLHLLNSQKHAESQS